jgi:sugar lactone lactonase YvrE
MRISPDGRATRFAGTGRSGYSGDDGPATQAELDNPLSVALGTTGEVYIADTDNSVIRRVDVDGTITTLASGLLRPQALALRQDGLLIVADTGHHRIVAIESDGTLHTIAGTGQAGYADDQSDARRGQLDWPCALDIGHDGVVFIADCENGKLRRLVPY